MEFLASESGNTAQDFYGCEVGRPAKYVAGLKILTKFPLCAQTSKKLIYATFHEVGAFVSKNIFLHH